MPKATPSWCRVNPGTTELIPSDDTGRPRSRLIQEMTQLSPHRWPLRRHDRIARRVASRVVSGHPMGSENPFELSTDAFERNASTLVARVGVKADTEHLPR